jgi:hypothetical protein
VFLRNVPGELGRFADLMAKSKINILAMFIQNASDYIHEMFEARGKAIKRTASAACYGSVMKEAKKYSLIRVIVDETAQALTALKQAQYWVTTTEVLVMNLQNRPGTLAKISSQFGKAGININYVYGSGTTTAKKAVYVFNVPDVDKALNALGK